MLEKGNTFFPETQISPEAFYFQKQVLLLMNQQMQIISDTASGMDQTLNQMKNLRNEMSKTKYYI